MFYIQVHNPRVNSKFDEEDKRLIECIETVYPLYTENGGIVWNKYYIPFCYKYDLSYMALDLINMVEGLQRGEKNIEVDFSSDTFTASWSIECNEDKIVINSDWGESNGAISNASIVDRQLAMSKESFLNEWKALFERVINDLEFCGYDSDRIEELGKLKDVSGRIADYGLLYCEKSLADDFILNQ